MAQQSAIMAILFADIAQSTKLYEKIGNSAAQRLISRCLAAMSDVCLRHNGTVIKTIGDEIMCSFSTAKDAVDAGGKMQSAIEKIPFQELPDGHSPNVYVGIDYGPVIQEHGDIFGDAVNVAARMAGMAKQRQILTTQETVDALPPEDVDCVRCIGKTVVKGKSKEMLIYEVISEKDTLTVMLKAFPGVSPVVKNRLELLFNNTIFEVSDTCPVATLGRQNQNDIVVKDTRVSRFHARIEYRREKYFLIDQSTNGTYVMEFSKDPVLLMRDEIQLDRNGVIDLCNEGTSASPTAIHYTVK